MLESQVHEKQQRLGEICDEWKNAASCMHQVLTVCYMNHPPILTAGSCSLIRITDVKEL
jgi:hypothetical protein